MLGADLPIGELPRFPKFTLTFFYVHKGRNACERSSDARVGFSINNDPD